jgi:hypothetical protein
MFCLSPVDVNMYGVKAKFIACLKVDTNWVHIVPMTRVSFSHLEYLYIKTHIITNGSTSTKKLTLVNISFDTPTYDNVNKDNNSLAIPSLAIDACNAGKGGGGGLGGCYFHLPRVLAMMPPPPLPRWRQVHPLPPLPCRRCPWPTMSIPSLPGCCSPPRQTCMGPPCRPSLLQACQQHK